MIKEYFKEYINLYPSLGSYVGHRKYNCKYENYLHPSFHSKVMKLAKKYNTKAKHLKPSIDTEMLLWITSNKIVGDKYNFDLIPLMSFNNDIIDFIFQNTSSYPLETKRDFNDLIERYKAFRPFIKSCKTKMQKGIKTGYTIPKMICKKMITYLRQHLKNKHYIVEIPEHLKKDTSLYNKYLRIVEIYYRKPVAELIVFLQQTYLPACRQSIGLCDLPDGKQMYKYCVKKELSLENVDIAEIHQYGLAEVARISAEMHDIKVKLGYAADMSLTEFYHHMTTDKKYQVQSADELLQMYEQKKSEINKTLIPKYFDFSVKPCVIKQTPKEIEQTSPAAFYVSSNKNKRSKGTMYINTTDMKDNFVYCIAPLTLHECSPGHHYQCQYLLDKKLPDHRIYLMDANVFVEGWALYCENFIDHTDVLQRFGRLTFDLYRSTRLVVDTGIHYYGWSYNKAVKYMQNNVPLGKKQIASEIERYTCMPAQALCYKIGEREIVKWKQMFIDKFGSSDDTMKMFHNVLLEDGNIPLQVLEKKINNMVAA